MNNRVNYLIGFDFPGYQIERTAKGNSGRIYFDIVHKKLEPFSIYGRYDPQEDSILFIGGSILEQKEAKNLENYLKELFKRNLKLQAFQ